MKMGGGDLLRMPWCVLSSGGLRYGCRLPALALMAGDVTQSAPDGSYCLVVADPVQCEGVQTCQR